MPFPLPDQGIYFLRDSGPLRENQLVEDWLRLPVGTELATLDGSPVIILQTGHRNRNAGPDIFQAQVYIAGTFSVGAVEFHVRAGDWYLHGHQNDPRYDRVILHVVTRVGRRHPDLPTVIFSSASHRRSCSVSPRSPHWEAQLKAFGSRQWMDLRTFFQENPTPEHLWQRCLHILGQGGNEDHFAALSRRLSWEEVTTCRSVETLNERVARLKIPWRHCSIRPAAWPERRIPLLYIIATMIARFIRQPLMITPEELPSSGVIPGAPSLSIELLGNCWYPWMAAQHAKMNAWEAVDVLRLAWERLRLPASYGILRSCWGNDTRLKNFIVAQGGLALHRRYCNLRTCHLCPLKLTTHALFN